MTSEYIQALIDGGIPESKTLEYKRELPKKDKDPEKEKKEFLKDVAALANAMGGIIIYGIDEKDGVPCDIFGVTVENEEAEQRRLELILSSGIEPRIPGLKTYWVPDLPEGKKVFVIQIPQSWMGPHMVNQVTPSFWVRRGNHKEAMDVTEIKNAFLGSDELPQRVRRFRDTRIVSITANATFIPLLPSTDAGHLGRVVIHITPIEAVTSRDQLSIDQLQKYGRRLAELNGASAKHQRFTFDGFICHGNTENSPRGYAHLFREGRIESLSVIAGDYNTRYSIRPNYEAEVVNDLVICMRLMLDMNMSMPYFVNISLIGVRGATFGLVSSKYPIDEDEIYPIDKEVLLLPDLLIEDRAQVLDENLIAAAMRPLFDTVWNATGIPHSLSYTKEGVWRPI